MTSNDDINDGGEKKKNRRPVGLALYTQAKDEKYHALDENLTYLWMIGLFYPLWYITWLYSYTYHIVLHNYELYTVNI